MIYQTLPLGANQIRLITIEPATLEQGENDKIRCRLEVFNLPVRKELRSDNLPMNYIDCERWVTSPPRERSREDIIESIQTALAENATKSMRLARHIANGVRRVIDAPRLEKDDLIIPIFSLMNLMDKEDIISNIENQELHHNFQILWPIDDNDDPLPPEKGYMARVRLEEIPRFYSPRAREADSLPVTIDPNNYMAMSYAWGDSNGPKSTIFVNGHPIEVGYNLAAGLRRFRSMEYFQKGGKLWVDSLCINQRDPEEKADQVQRMGRIYNEAGNIIVWLGEGDEMSDFAIGILENLSKMQRAEYIEVYDNADPVLATAWREIGVVRAATALRKFIRGLARSGLPFASELLEGEAIHSFFNRPYWRRLWVIQELSNGRAGMPIVCGARVTQWRYIRDAAIAYCEILNSWQIGTSRGALNDHTAFHIATIAKLEIRAHRRLLPEIDKRITLPLRSTPEPGAAFQVGSGLREALILASNAESQEPRDRVYGMLHIPSLPDLGIKVDYFKPVARIYKEFTEACIRKGSPRDILFLLDGRGMSAAAVSNGTSEDEQLNPSWVPDFGANRLSRPGMIEGDWYASNNSPAFQRIIDVTFGLCLPYLEDDQLYMHGFVADMVVGVGAINPLDVDLDSTPWPPDFQEGVVQPGPVNTDKLVDDVLNSMTNGYDCSSFDQPGEEIASSTVPWVLVAGSMVGGSRGGLGHGKLLNSFPAQEPALGSPDYRNWHFINANADFLIQGKPLRSYVSYREPTNDSDSDGSYDSPETFSEPEFAAARQAMTFRTRNRRLFITASGLLGLAPAAAQPGDYVLIIMNHGVPIVARPAGIRRHPDRDLPVVAWRIIGECFVHGMMEGEMVRKRVREGPRTPDYLTFV
ncbi:heterokaryon incompatibility protein-domain-containing protein [Aspergillus ambiguus]|uniref:HET domain-containing protein n=1 Tax=Aspergillus ambiguus TaxID=176160 RepID=UPI003CCE0907